MKRAVSLLLSAALLLGLLSACRKEEKPESLEHTAEELVEAGFQLSGYDGKAGLEYLTNTEGGTREEDGKVFLDKEVLTVYLENAYNIFAVELPWEDAAVVRSTGAAAFEIAVLRMADEDTAVMAASSFMSYIFRRQGDFAGYAPAEADMVANGSILQIGPYAGLFICPDPDGAYEAVKAALSGEPLSVKPDREEGRTTGVKALRDLLVTGQGMDGADLELLDDGGPEALEAYVEDVYGLKPDQWEECAVARGGEDSGFEVAVLRVPEDWDTIGEVEQRLNSYLDDREAQLSGSSQEVRRLLHGALVVETSPYVVLLACADRMGAMDAFTAAAGVNGYGYSLRYRYLDTDPDYPDRCLFTAPNEDDMSLYDISAILAAWGRGDPSGLSEYDRDIYNQAEKVLGELLKDGMSDYEKELAVYNWVVNNVDYDWTHQNILVKTPRESFTPYGGLVNRTAVCLGYATTFQLLMDLAGVECITVPGAAFSSGEDHGWNMVKLDGEWYCVDVTWDANVREQIGRGRQEDWDYFNVTSDYMADTDHQWDYANTPEATAEDHGRG